MSIMEKLFGKSTPQQSQQPVPTNNPATTPSGQTAVSQGTAPNGVIPAGAAAEPPAPAPLEKFKDLWQEPAPSNDQQQQQQPAAMDPQKLMEAAAKVDFSKVVDAESMAKIAAGGEEAAQAMVALLNKTAQQVYGQSAVMTAKVVEQAVAQAQERFTSQIPDTLRRQNARAAVFEANPAFANPAIAPLIEAQVSQLALKFPKATPSELNAMAKEYLTDMAGLIAPPKRDASAAQKQTSQNGDDFSDYA